MSKISKSLQAFFHYLLCPIIFEGEPGAYRPRIQRGTQIFFLIITAISTIIFRSLLAFSIPVLVYISVYLIRYHIDFRYNFKSFYDEISPLTYERFLAEYTCFPDRILCDDYISMFVLKFVVDDVENHDYCFSGENQNLHCCRFIKPQTFHDAVLIYYYLLPIYTNDKKKKYGKEAAEYKKLRNKQEAENYAIFKKYFTRDLETLDPQATKKIAKCKNIIKDLKNSP